MYINQKSDLFLKIIYNSYIFGMAESKPFCPDGNMYKDLFQLMIKKAWLNHVPVAEETVLGLGLRQSDRLHLGGGLDIHLQVRNGLNTR